MYMHITHQGMEQMTRLIYVILKMFPTCTVKVKPKDVNRNCTIESQLQIKSTHDSTINTITMLSLNLSSLFNSLESYRQ